MIRLTPIHAEMEIIGTLFLNSKVHPGISRLTYLDLVGTRDGQAHGGASLALGHNGHVVQGVQQGVDVDLVTSCRQGGQSSPELGLYVYPTSPWGS